MGLAESLRAVAGSLGGFQDDYDEYDDNDQYAGDDVRADAGTSEHDDSFGGRERGRSSGRRGRDDDAGYDDIYREEPCRSSRPAGERPAPPLALVRPRRTEFALVAPQDFDAVQGIADLLKAGDPVIVDLQSCGKELATRLIDFCSGLTYAVEGSLQFVGENALLLSPSNVEPSSGEPGALHERPFFNQK